MYQVPGPSIPSELAQNGGCWCVRVGGANKGFMRVSVEGVSGGGGVELVTKDNKEDARTAGEL